MLKTYHTRTGYLTMKMKCGECLKVDENEASNYQENINTFKDLGWLVYHDAGIWKHRCPDCNHDASAAQKVTFLEKLEKRKNIYSKFIT